MARGKVISVYLIDGVANGKIKATISNWNGIAYKIPRRLLDECKELDAFKQSGVYFLFGNNMVYVGQAEVRKNGKGIHQRILDHENDKYNGMQRYYTPKKVVLTFGKYKVLLTKEWYEKYGHRDLFIKWYTSLV